MGKVFLLNRLKVNFNFNQLINRLKWLILINYYPLFLDALSNAESASLLKAVCPSFRWFIVLSAIVFIVKASKEIWQNIIFSIQKELSQKIVNWYIDKFL